MHGEPRGLALGRHHQEGLLAQHEEGGTVEEMQPDHRRAGLDRSRAPGDGRDPGTIVSHGWPPSREAALEAFADLVLVEVAPDEHDPAFALLDLAPRPLVVAVENHVHALEHEALRVVLERQDAFAAQDARPVLGDQVLHPREEPIGIERPVGPERERLHLLVVIVLQAVMVVMTVMVIVAMVVAVVIMVMMVIMLLGLEELGLDLEDTVEIEGVASQHLGQRHLAALGHVHARIGVDGADAHLDLAQLAGRPPGRSC